MDYSERLLRRDREARTAATRPKASSTASRTTRNPANRDLRIKATVTVEGSDIHVDLTAPRRRSTCR